MEQIYPLTFFFFCVCNVYISPSSSLSTISIRRRRLLGHHSPDISLFSLADELYWFLSLAEVGHESLSLVCLVLSFLPISSTSPFIMTCPTNVICLLTISFNIILPDGPLLRAYSFFTLSSHDMRHICL